VAHRLVGLAVSLWLLLLGATGALLAFKDDWLSLAQPAIAGPPPSGQAQSPAGLARRAKAAETAFGTDRVWALVLAGSPIALDQVYLRDQAGVGYLDPETGAVVARWAGNERFVDLLFELHRALLLGDAGKKAVGFLGLAGMALVLSGPVLAWPTFRRWRGAVWPRDMTRSALVVAHRQLGLLAALPLLVMTSSGLALVFPVTTKGLLRALSGLPAPTPIAQTMVASSDIAWEAVFTAARARFPAASLRVAVWPNAPGTAVAVWLRQSTEWHPNGRTIFYATAAGDLADVRDAAAAPPADRLVNAAYAVHAGKVGGLPYRSLVALTGLALALLSSYGAVAYGRHLFGSRRRRSIHRLQAR
jgi:uncharacterized iron-regulated membrane protein